MSDPNRNKKDTVPDGDKAIRRHKHEDDFIDDEEKILAGRHDVNYPALLTKDVPGG
jgi:hypothetical protein